MQKIAKLLDDNGAGIDNQEFIEGSVSFDVRDGVAQAWGSDGKTLVASMVKARVVWMGLKGLRIDGMEVYHERGLMKYRAMEWQIAY